MKKKTKKLLTAVCVTSVGIGMGEALKLKSKQLEKENKIFLSGVVRSVGEGFSLIGKIGGILVGVSPSKSY